MSNRRSLQNRLIISAVLTVIVLGAISNYVAYRVVNYRLTRAFDDALESKAKALLSLTKVEKDGNIEIEFASDSMPEYASRVSPEYFLIISERGEVLARSPSLAAADVARMPQKHFTSQRAFDHPLPDGRMGRVLVFQGSPIVEKDSEEEWQPADPNAASLGDPLWVVVARERAPLDRSLRHIAIALIFGTLFLGFAGTVVLVAIVRHGLSPLRKLAEDVENVDISSLETRFLTPHLPQELVPIAEKLDELFARLRKAITRERRYTSDVAHELRTPLTEISVALEVAEKFANPSDEVLGAIRQALEATAECRTLVETLLEMARHGENARKPPMDRLDFFSIVQDECMRLSEKALERQLRVVQHCGTQGAMVQSNEYLLRTIVRNLLGNAVDYAPEHTEITVEMNYDSARGGTLSISNYARDLSPADLENMTEPFWRKDSARTDRQHSGLGLTLAKSIAKLLDLRLSFSLSPGHLFTVTLQWPAPRE